MDPTPTILAQGARGECVQRLVALLSAAGSPPMSAIDDSQLVLDEAVMQAVKKAQGDLDITEQDTLTFGDVVIKGQFVGPATWEALYKEAEARTGLVQPNSAIQQPAPAADQTAAEAAAQTAAQAAGVQEPGSAIKEQPAVTDGGGTEQPPAAGALVDVSATEEEKAREQAPPGGWPNQ